MKGQVEMQLGYKGYRLEKNHMLFIAAGQVFSVLSLSPDSAICHFSQQMLTRIATPALLQGFPFLQVWGNPYVELPEQKATFILRLLERLQVEYVQYGLQHPCLLSPICLRSLAN